MLCFESKFNEFLIAKKINVKKISYKRSGGLATASIFLCGESNQWILFCHGTGNDRLFPYVHFFSGMLERGFNLVSFDLDGHGAESTSFFDQNEIAGCVGAAAEAAEIELSDAIIIGHSLGAALAVGAAAENKVKALIGISLPVRTELGVSSFLNEMMSPLYSSFKNYREFYPWREKIPAFGPFRRNRFPVRTIEAGAYFRIINRYVSSLNLQRSLTNVQAPCFLLGSERDLLTPIAPLLELSQPNVSKFILCGENHYTTMFSHTLSEVIPDWIARL